MGSSIQTSSKITSNPNPENEFDDSKKQLTRTQA